jgi:tRNA threonylcarbamoyl adenosine modification protein YeaZ
MRWLAIETSSSLVSLALGEDAAVVREVAEEGSASRRIEPLFRSLDADLSKIQRCVIGQGPGSYNGLRVGYAFLKGLLCFGTIPVVQVPTPIILAAAAAKELAIRNGNFLVLNNARRGEIYGALVELRNDRFEKTAELVAAQEVIVRQLAGLIDAVVSADFRAADLPLLKKDRWLVKQPMAGITGRLAFTQNLPATDHLPGLEPHYVREPVPGVAPNRS